MSNKEKKPSGVKKFFSDFKAFITKGNILDLAVAVIIGGAFGKIVTSLVDDIIMPLIALAVGGVSVQDWKWVITAAQYNAEGVQTVAENALRYGIFLQNIIDFLVIAFFIFLVLRVVVGIQQRWSKLEAGIIEYSGKERKAMVKELKKQGKKWPEIDRIIKEREDAENAAHKAEEDAKKALEEANKPPSTEQLLTEIRDLLKKNSV